MLKKRPVSLLKSLNFKIIIYFIAFAFLPLLVFSILGYYLNQDMITRINLNNLHTVNLNNANKINTYLASNKSLLLNESLDISRFDSSVFSLVEKYTYGKAVIVYPHVLLNNSYLNDPYLEYDLNKNNSIRGYFSVHKLQEVMQNDIPDIRSNLYFVDFGILISSQGVDRVEKEKFGIRGSKLKPLSSDSSWHMIDEQNGKFSAFTYFQDERVIVETQIAAATFYAELINFRNKIILANLMLVIILFALAFYYSRQITTPLHKLITAVQDIGKGNLDERLDVQSNDEIQILATEFELMRQKLQESYQSLEDKINRRTRELQGAQAQIMHQEKMASLGLMAAGIAHEIGNPLTSISSMAQIIKRKNTDEKTIEYVNNILKNIDRISRIVRELVDFSKPTTHKAAPTDINEIIYSAVGIVKYDRRSKNITYTLDLDKNLSKIYVVSDHLMQVFLNILINAIDASEGLSEEINVSTYTNNGDLNIEIRDHGTGIPEEYLNKIFEPFYTTKEVGKGTGLGLTVSYGLIKKLKGEIKVTSKVKEGSVFTVVIPNISGTEV